MTMNLHRPPSLHVANAIKTDRMTQVRPKGAITPSGWMYCSMSAESLFSFSRYLMLRGERHSSLFHIAR
jgi:hypothetical protein